MTPWRERLDWTGERSPSNAERLKAAEDEIKDLRKQLGLEKGRTAMAKKSALMWQEKYSALTHAMRKALKQ